MNNKEGLMFDRRGLSAVVTTLILVLLVIVAIAIVWGVVQNLLVNSEEQIDSGTITVSLNVVSALKTPESAPTQIAVKVERKAGEGDLRKLKIVLEDANGQTQVFTEEVTGADSLNELEQRTFTYCDTSATGCNGVLDATGKFSADDVVKVTVVPLIGENDLEGIHAEQTARGGTVVVGGGGVGTTYNYNQYVDQLVPLHWWKFDDIFSDGITDDSEGSLQSVVGSSVSSSSDSISGNSAGFSGSSLIGSTYMTYAQVSSLSAGSSFTISGWVKRQTTSNTYQAFTTSTGGGDYRILIVSSTGRLLSTQDSSDFSSTATGIVPLNTWTHIVYWTDGTEERFYINGVLDNSRSSSVIAWNHPNSYIGFSNSYPFKGNIDEYIIFGRALSDQEIRNLYDVSLSGSITI